jgi:hypothetical protein
MSLSPRLSAAFVLAACGVLGPAAPASAAWNNVFQVCCHDCDRPRASYYAPAPAACPQPCPQPEVRISYVQRCYYQPVTEYVRRSYYEPVTRNYTSYYYEPVTEYRYTTYYDPCTGCPQRVCTPTTSYRMRSKCNSVTSYVERCAMVPVTSLRPVTVRQPVVTYYYPPEPACPPTAAAPFAAPSGPAVEQIREQPPSVIPPSSGSDANIPSPMVPTQPGAYPRTGPAATPRLRPDKTTSASKSDVVTVRGEVVMPDQLTPRGGAKLVFVNAANADQREFATANPFGEFDVRLPAGNWYLYLGGDDGRAVYHKQVSLGAKDTYDYRVVSR